MVCFSSPWEHLENYISCNNHVCCMSLMFQGNMEWPFILTQFLNYKFLIYLSAVTWKVSQHSIVLHQVGSALRQKLLLHEYLLMNNIKCITCYYLCVIYLHRLGILYMILNGLVNCCTHMHDT